MWTVDVELFKKNSKQQQRLHSLNNYYAANESKEFIFCNSIITLLCIVKEALFEQTTVNKIP